MCITLMMSLQSEGLWCAHKAHFIMFPNACEEQNYKASVKMWKISKKPEARHKQTLMVMQSTTHFRMHTNTHFLTLYWKMVLLYWLNGKYSLMLL